MNVFDLFAKISLDTKGYEQDLKGAQSSFSKFGDGLKSAAGKVGDVLAGIGKTAAAGIGVASTALTALTKQSLDAVADYEQLVGGVDKIFGESSKKVQEYANQAYAEAGLSANQYMETVTSFSASLLQSLGGDTEAAADAANRAIIDMADNVNTYGSSMESVMNAYQGFSKANYTMLDNLKLGYGGTKEEMQRLIQDASQMNEEMQKLGVTVDADSMSFGNIVNAISVMQERMKIAGTTHNEAARTISGSIASMKAAWQNFLTGTSSPAQFTKVLKDVVRNIKTNLNDIIPRLTEGLTELADQLAPEIPEIIEGTLPAVITGASSLLTGLAGKLPQLITAILPALSQGVVDVSVELVRVMPQLVSSLKQSIPIVLETIWAKKDKLLQAGKDLIKAIFPDKLDTQSVSSIASKATSVVGSFLTAVTKPDNFKKIFNTGIDIINELVNGLLSPESINAFFDNAGKIIGNLVDGIKYALIGDEQDDDDGLFGAAKNIVIKIGDFFASSKNSENFGTAAYKILKSLASHIKDILEQGVAPLMVEIARTWMELFIGEIDYNDAALDIIQRLGEAFIHNMVTGGVIGAWIERSATDYVNEMDEQVESDNSYDVMLTAEGMRRAGVPQAGIDAYILRYGGHAKGFYANRPAFLTNDIVGENGDEVLLPLDSNTVWMDKLADKLGSRMSGGVVIESVIINTNSDNGADIADSFVERLSEKLSDLQGRESRGYGLGYIGGSWQ